MEMKLFFLAVFLIHLPKSIYPLTSVPLFTCPIALSTQKFRIENTPLNPDNYHKIKVWSLSRKRDHRLASCCDNRFEYFNPSLHRVLLEKAATCFALHRNHELTLEIKRDLILLEGKIVEEKEKEEWERLCSMVALNIGSDSSNPWEPVEGDEENESDNLLERFGVMNGTYLSAQNFQADIVGKMKILSRATVQNTFDQVIREQKQKADKRGWGALLHNAEISRTPKLNAADIKWQASKRRLEGSINAQRQVLRMRSPRFHEFEHARGRAALGRYSLPWPLLEERVLFAMNDVLRDRYEGPDAAPGDFDRRRQALAALDSSAAARDALRLPRGPPAAQRDPDAEVRSDPAGDDDHAVAAAEAEAAAGRVDIGDSAMLLPGAYTELAGVRAYVEALRFAAEELIRDANRWCEPGHALPYQSLAEFREYAAAAVAREGGNGTFSARFADTPLLLAPLDDDDEDGEAGRDGASGAAWSSVRGGVGGGGLAGGTAGQPSSARRRRDALISEVPMRPGPARVCRCGLVLRGQAGPRRACPEQLRAHHTKRRRRRRRRGGAGRGGAVWMAGGAPGDAAAGRGVA